MVFVVLGLTVVLVVVVALLSVGWAVGSTRDMPDQIVIDAHEGIEFCAEALPDHVTAELTYNDLRRILRLHLEWVQFYHWAPEGKSEVPVLYEQFDAVDYVVERAEMTDLHVPKHHIVEVIRAHDSYLQVSGAIHIDDPIAVESDLAELPMLDSPAAQEALEDGAEPTN
ncbi:MAG: hypothetical protein AAF467_08100 [Actinomycetota bacterium]